MQFTLTSCPIYIAHSYRAINRMFNYFLQSAAGNVTEKKKKKTDIFEYKKRRNIRPL